VRVVLAEDLALLRDGLVRLLRAHEFDVVAAVDNGPALRQALAAIAFARPERPPRSLRRRCPIARDLLQVNPAALGFR
jgi:hypothetical protein